MSLKNILDNLPSDKTFGGIIGKVVAVNGHLCDVQPLNDDAIVYDVRLISEDSSGLRLIPKIGSIAFVILFENNFTGFLAMCSELEEAELKVGNSLVNVSSDQVLINRNDASLKIGQGIEIKNGAEDLKAILVDLLTALQTLTVTCAAPGSPSTVPVNTAVFATIKTRLNGFFL